MRGREGGQLGWGTYEIAVNDPVGVQIVEAIQKLHHDRLDHLIRHGLVLAFEELGGKFLVAK